MSKKKIVQKIADLGWRHEPHLDINKAIQALEEAKNKGANYLFIGIDYAYGESIMKVYAYSEREETDEEYNQRIENNRLKEFNKDMREFKYLFNKYPDMDKETVLNKIWRPKNK